MGGSWRVRFYSIYDGGLSQRVGVFYSNLLYICDRTCIAESYQPLKVLLGIQLRK